MSESSITIKFTCKKCGGTKLVLPDDPTDDSIAACTQCGTEFGRWGDIKAHSLQLAKEEAIAKAKEIFKRR